VSRILKACLMTMTWRGALLPRRLRHPACIVNPSGTGMLPTGWERRRLRWRATPCGLVRHRLCGTPKHGGFGYRSVTRR
jgi:hypothetical protein